MLKKNIFLLLAVLLCTHGMTYADDQSGDISPQDMKKLSKAFGHFIGRNLKSSGIQFDVDSVAQGVKEGAAGKESPMSDQEYEQMMARAQTISYKKIADRNIQEANDFLKKNSAKNGIVQLDEGKLQYEILEDGTGEPVKSDGTPIIHYTGKFVDGKVFGSSKDSGPVTIPLDHTIPGFKKGITGMKEGEKRRLYVHPDLGYGTTGHLPPNSLLIFDVEVINADSANDDESNTSYNDESEDIEDVEDIDDVQNDDNPEEEKSGSWWPW